MACAIGSLAQTPSWAIQISLSGRCWVARRKKLRAVSPQLRCLRCGMHRKYRFNLLILLRYLNANSAF
jgi:hypothetical protein